jgi:hypothetical protein
MDKTMTMIPSCEDVARAITDGSYIEGPCRWRLRLHMFFCWVCRRYAAQIRWIDKASKGVLTSGVDAGADFKRRLLERLRR